MEIGKQEMPVFVKIDEYKDIIDILNLTKDKIRRAKHIMLKINQLKSQESAELNAWEKELGDIERRVDQIDRTLFEPEV